MQVRPNLYAISPLSNVWWIIIPPLQGPPARPSELTILRFQSGPPRNLVSSPSPNLKKITKWKWSTSRHHSLHTLSRPHTRHGPGSHIPFPSHFRDILYTLEAGGSGNVKIPPENVSGNPSLKINILHLKLFAEISLKSDRLTISCMFWWDWQTSLKPCT